jgi:hypothetical protein
METMVLTQTWMFDTKRKREKAVVQEKEAEVVVLEKMSLGELLYFALMEGQ